MSQKSNIIYIIGAGRSGTTLLDIILGNADDIFSVGELNRFTKRNGIPHDARDKEVSHFWQQVTKELSLKGFNQPRNYYPVASKYEYHSNCYRLFLPYRKTRSFKTYIKHQRALFASIREYVLESTGKYCMLDSSKYPLRGYFLSKIFGTNISFVYIKRNPCAVVESFQKQDVEQPAKSRFMANLYLLGVNCLAASVVKLLRRKNQVSVISYEGLLSSPVKTLEQIEKDLDIDLALSKKIIAAEEPLQVGLLFDGNRLRLNQTVVFKKSISSIKPVKLVDKLFYALHRLTWFAGMENTREQQQESDIVQKLNNIGSRVFEHHQ